MSKFDPYEHLNVSLNPDGSLTRHLNFPKAKPTEAVAAAVTEEEEKEDGLVGKKLHHQDHAVVSKDVVLDSDKSTWIRIYRPGRLPSNDNCAARLPIIINFHGGGWILQSVADTILHNQCNLLALEALAIVAAVEYRLAPESKLPAQYDDAIDAINWIRNQALDQTGDPWLKDYGDFSRCYLYGTSCGANIAFNAALKILDLNLSPMKISGLILNQPFFGGKRRTKTELKLATDYYFPLPVQDTLWELALPAGTDRDHRYCNPFKDFSIREKVRSVKRCLVIGFGGDPLIERQQELVRMLMMQGVRVEARFDEVGFHMIDLIDQRRAAAIRSFIKDFI